MKHIPKVTDILNQLGVVDSNHNIEVLTYWVREIQRATLEQAALRAMIAEDVTNDEDYSDAEEPLNAEGRRIISTSGGHIREEHYVEVDKNSILSLINNPELKIQVE